MIGEQARLEMSSGKGTKDDVGKPRMSLMPGEALIPIAKVFTYGAAKYSDHNYRNGMSWRRMCDAAERHLVAWKMGEDTDPESNLPHLAHLGCCVMMLLVYAASARYQRFDDRWKEPVCSTEPPRLRRMAALVHKGRMLAFTILRIMP